MVDETRRHYSEPDPNPRTTLQRRLESALDGAEQYGASLESNDEKSGDVVRPMEEWSDIVSQRIEDAMRQGLFDGLSGHGKPLTLDRDPFLPEDQQMAVDLLRNNGLAPEWISERTSILAAIDAVREELDGAATQSRSELSRADSEEQRDVLQRKWTAWVEGWRKRVVKLNDRILVHNLKQPVSHLEIYQLRLSDELARAGVDPGSV